MKTIVYALRAEEMGWSFFEQIWFSYSFGLVFVSYMKNL